VVPFDSARLDACAVVEDTLRAIARAFKAGRATSATSSLYVLPEELSRLPRTLYSLRHGPLLGEVNKSVDDSFLARLVFLRSGVEDSLIMMAPPLLSTRGQGAQPLGMQQLYHVPAETLALWSDAVLVHDQYSRLFLWRGHQAPKGGEAEDQQLLDAYMEKAMVKRRFPAPTVLCCKEGSSMARYIVSRLNPLHHDNPGEQLLSFPMLQGLDLETRTDISKKFLRTDVPSFKTWLRAVVAKS